MNGVLEKVSLPLLAAALDPRYGHLRFVDEALREEVWDTLAQWTVSYSQEMASVRDPVPMNADAPVSTGPADLEDTAMSLLDAQAALASVRAAFEKSPPDPADPLALPTPEMVHAYLPQTWWNKARRNDECLLLVYTYILFKVFFYFSEAHKQPAIRLWDIVRIVHMTPATSAASERVFSNAKLNTSPLRNRLSSDKLEMLTIIRQFIIDVENRGGYEGVKRVIHQLATILGDIELDDTVSSGKKRKQSEK